MTIAYTRSFLAGTVILLMSRAAHGQPARPATLNFVVRAGEYHGTMYVTPPTIPAQFLIFKTEGLSLTLAVGNATDVDLSVSLNGVGPAQGFKVTPIRVPIGGTVPALQINPVADMTSRGITTPQSWVGLISVPPRGNLVWTGTLFLPPNAAPGVYELQITPVFGTADGPALNPLGTLVRYEVRDVVSDEDRAELSRRRMMHAYVAGTELDAEAAADELLRLYPQSALAYQVKGEIAKRQGRKEQAVQSLQHAVNLISLGQDVVYMTHTPAHEVDRTLQSMRQTVQLLQRQP
jgi:hypothetical protein